MPFSITLKDGTISLGASGYEDKVFSFTPKDSDGNVLTPSTITLDIEAPSATETKSKADFTQNGDAWEYTVRFDEAGSWSFSLTVEDQNGNAESLDPGPIQIIP